MKFLILLLIPMLALGYVPSNDRTIEADKIESLNQGDTTFLNPVKVDGYTGNFVLQSSGTKEIEESTVTNTELSYLSGVTSSIQTQIDGKENSLPWDTNGDMVYYQGPLVIKIPIGTQGQLLTVGASNNPLWQDAPVSVPTTTKGDLSTHDGANPDRLPVGLDGQILTADSAESLGLKWITAPSSSPTTTQGDLILRGLTVDERLPIGTVDQLLTSDGTTASWQDAPISTTLTTKGDIQTYDTANQRLPVGNDGEFLVADSNETTGLKWSSSISGLISQAHIVGESVYKSTNCVSNTVGSTLVWEVLGSDADCVPENTGNVVGSDNFTIDINNVRTDGVYKVTFTGLALIASAGGTGQVRLTLSDSTSYDDQGIVNLDRDFYRAYNSIEGSFRFSTTTPKTISLLKYSSSVNTLSVYGRPDLASKFIVTFYPDTNNVAAFQNVKPIHISAQRATGLNIPNNTDTVLPYNSSVKGNEAGHYDTTTGVFTSPIKSDYKVCATMLFNAASWPINSIMQMKVTYGAGFSKVKIPQWREVESSQTQNFNLNGCVDIPLEIGEQFKVEIQHDAGGSRFVIANEPYNNLSILQILETGVIAGTFENINSSDIAVLNVSNSAGGSIGTVATDIVFPTVEKDNYSAYNNTTGEYTVPKDGIYNIKSSLTTAAINLATNSRMVVQVYKNGSRLIDGERVSGSGNTVNNAAGVNVSIPLLKNDVIKIAATIGVVGATMETDAAINYLHIVQSADFESLVANLSDTADKCQTKRLSTTVTSTGIMSDLTFNNLTIGKRYSYRLQLACKEQDAVADSLIGCLITAENGASYISGVTEFQQSSSASIVQFRHNMVIPTIDFVATATTVTVNASTLVNAQIQGNLGLGDESATLCELNNTIETTEFN